MNKIIAIYKCFGHLFMVAILLILMVLLLQGCITTEMLSVDPVVKQTAKQQADIVLKAAGEAEKTYEDAMFALSIARDELTGKSDKTKEDFARLVEIAALQMKAKNIYTEYSSIKAEVKNLVDIYTGEDDSDLQIKVDELNRVIRRLVIEITIRSVL